MGLLSSIGKFAGRLVSNFIPGGNLAVSAINTVGGLIGGGKAKSANNEANQANQLAIQQAADASRAGLQQQQDIFSADRAVGNDGRAMLRSFGPGGQNSTTAVGRNLQGSGLDSYIQGLLNPDNTRSFGAADFQADPGYQFRQQEGERAGIRAANAAGGQFSGATLRDLARFNSNLASDEYGRAYSRFREQNNDQFNKRLTVAELSGRDQQQQYERAMGLTGVGSTADARLVDGIRDNATNLGNLALGSGAARADTLKANGAVTQGQVAGVTGSLADFVNQLKRKPTIPLSALYNNQTYGG